MGRVEAIIGALARGEPCSGLLAVMAHPDDEVLWIGAALADREVALVHLTSGAPRDPFFAAQAGCAGEEAYAALRERELDAALAVLGLAAAARTTLGARDQEAALSLTDLSRALAAFLVERRPSALIAHAYDGGHPDHDATAFVARAAVLLARRHVDPPALIDAAGYHAGRAGLEVGFLRRPENERGATIALSDMQRERKARALACFASQRDVIARLDTSIERLRPGAREDFASAPHPGRLHYEEHGRPIDGAAFRRHAEAAARALGVPLVLGW